jgi:hypothetical protein
LYEAKYLLDLKDLFFSPTSVLVFLVRFVTDPLPQVSFDEAIACSTSPAGAWLCTQGRDTVINGYLFLLS